MSKIKSGAVGVPFFPSKVFISLALASSPEPFSGFFSSDKAKHLFKSLFKYLRQRFAAAGFAKSQLCFFAK